MNIVVRAYRSSLGKKYIMALSGLALFLFVIVHMAGNLQVYLGPEAINAYAAFLKAHKGLLWSARTSLLILAIAHIVTAVQLTAENRAARPEPYKEGRPTAASFASRTIFVSGLVVFAFILYHLMHFTVGLTNPEFLQFKDPADPLRHDVYHMMIAGFSNVPVSLFYIFSMALLCAHLSHGVSSMFQSLGIRRRSNIRLIHGFARFSALVIFLGNCSIPVAVLTRLLK